MDWSWCGTHSTVKMAISFLLHLESLALSLLGHWLGTQEARGIPEPLGTVGAVTLGGPGKLASRFSPAAALQGGGLVWKHFNVF